MNITILCLKCRNFVTMQEDSAEVWDADLVEEAWPETGNNQKRNDAESFPTCFFYFFKFSFSISDIPFSINRMLTDSSTSDLINTTAGTPNINPGIPNKFPPTVTDVITQKGLTP